MPAVWPIRGRAVTQALVGAALPLTQRPRAGVYSQVTTSAEDSFDPGEQG